MIDYQLCVRHTCLAEDDLYNWLHAWWRMTETTLLTTKSYSASPRTSDSNWQHWSSKDRLWHHIKKFESTDPSKISIVRTRYENHHMVKGQSVIMYLTTMIEFRNQLKRMGEIIADSTHTATILRNVPESWRTVAQTIRMITWIPDEMKESLKVHKADLNALEISDQVATTFITWTKPTPPTQNRPNTHNNETPPTNSLRTPYICNNCSRNGHLVARCYVTGGGLEGQAPWMENRGLTNINTQQPNNPFTNRAANNPPRPPTATAWLAEHKPNDIIMMA